MHKKNEISYVIMDTVESYLWGKYRDYSVRKKFFIVRGLPRFWHSLPLKCKMLTHILEFQDGDKKNRQVVIENWKIAS